jgi:transposase
MESRVDVFARIRRDARVEGLGNRALARRHGVGRQTVRLALVSPEPPAKKTRVRSAPRLDRFKPVIDEMLREDLEAPRKQKHTATRVFDRLIAEHGATELSYSTVRNYVRARRPRLTLPRAGGRTCSSRRSTCRARKPRSTSVKSGWFWPA